MSFARFLRHVLVLLVLAVGARAADTAYLFTYFTGNGADGLHLAWSEDGYRWEALGGGARFLVPQIGKDKLMRDPSVVAGPDGTYHLVWTTGWWDRGIGHASTRDFLTWSEQQSIPVMEYEPTTRNAWAPEVVWDAQRSRFLVYWASTIPGKFTETAGASEDALNHRLYATTTTDWKTFAPTQLFCDPGFSVIDAAPLPGADGRFWLVVKDETVNPVKKHLRVAVADAPAGPWRDFGAPISRDWVEGPTAIRVGADTILYFDVYKEKHYGALRSRDLNMWEDITSSVSLPSGARHGTMLAVPRTLVERIKAARPDAPAATPAAVATPAPDLAVNPAATARPRDPKLPTIFIAGDSTAARSGGDAQQGWAVPFADYFDAAKINVVNRARGGRSSRTFITEGLWDELLADVKAGDFVLIQFGHNDGGAINEEPPGSTRPLRARGSLPGLGEENTEIDNAVTKKHEIVHTFGWYIRKMVADVKARGAKPILLSLTLRNIWTDGKVERGPGSYRAWDRAIAESEGIAFVDLSRILSDSYQELGQEKVALFFAKDHTHTTPAGADFTAAAVVAGLRGLRQSPWDAFLSAKGLAVEKDSIGWLNLPEPADHTLPSVVLIGDSTVRNGRGDGEGGQWGWGDALPALVDTAKLNVVNRAIGGLSSRTFMTQGHWSRAKMLMKKGDFLVIQFGHNDDSPVNDEKRARGTLKGVGEQTEEIDNLITKQHEIVHTYGWYLRQYIREARALGVTPILCSPVPRKKWADGKVVRSTTDGHAAWARQVAAEEQIGFIDLNALVAQRYDALGSEEVERLFADEHTHTSRAGAELNAAVVNEALRALPGGELLPYLRAP
jgi:lysophospholipase L1-like esterase